MDKVVVCRYRRYVNVAIGDNVISTRMVTRKGLQILGVSPIEGSDIEIDRADLLSGTEWTPYDYVPKVRPACTRAHSPCDSFKFVAINGDRCIRRVAIDIEAAVFVVLHL